MRFGLVSVSGPVGTDAFIHGVQTWGSIGTMSVATGNGLHLLGVSNYRGGIVAGGSGLVRQAGDAFVHATPEPTRIEVSRYLWDGELPSGGGGAASDTTVLAGAKLYITGAIGTSALDGFDGTVYVQNGAELFVEDNWILEGELVLEGGRILAGGILTNRGSIRGYGSIETMVLNEGDIECDGGSLLWCGSCYVDAGGTCGPAGCCPP
jgi:hypothetical protein